MSGYFGGDGTYSEHVRENPRAHWPSGARWARYDSLPWLLLGSARDNALRALQLYVSENRLNLLQAAVAVGAAVEQAVKACVASIEPALLADRGQIESVLWLTDHRGLTTQPATRIRTISGVEAGQICRDRKTGVHAPQSEVERAMNVRNSATHMALVDQDELRSSIPMMVRIVDSIVVTMKQEREAFWGERIHLVEGLIQELLEETAAVVTAKLATARARVAELTTGLDDQTRRLVLASRSRPQPGATWFSGDQYETQVDCPACGQLAELSGYTYWRDAGRDEDGRHWFSKWVEPQSIRCPVCDLWLEGYDELAVVEEASDFELGEYEEEGEGDEHIPDRFGDY